MVSHGDGGGRDDVVDEEEERVLGTQLYSLADEEVELSDGQVGRHEVLLLVELGDLRLRRALHDHLHSHTHTTYMDYIIQCGILLSG